VIVTARGRQGLYTSSSCSSTRRRGRLLPQVSAANGIPVSPQLQDGHTAIAAAGATTAFERPHAQHSVVSRRQNVPPVPEPRHGADGQMTTSAIIVVVVGRRSRKERGATGRVGHPDRALRRADRQQPAVDAQGHGRGELSARGDLSVGIDRALRIEFLGVLVQRPLVGRLRRRAVERDPRPARHGQEIVFGVAIIGGCGRGTEHDLVHDRGRSRLQLEGPRVGEFGIFGVAVGEGRRGRTETKLLRPVARFRGVVLVGGGKARGGTTGLETNCRLEGLAAAADCCWIGRCHDEGIVMVILNTLSAPDAPHTGLPVRRRAKATILTTILD